MHFVDIEGKVPEHRPTGQYRNKSNRIWDPHPQYLIDAFGVHLHLILYQDNSFIPKHMKVSFWWQRHTIILFVIVIRNIQNKSLTVSMFSFFLNWRFVIYTQTTTTATNPFCRLHTYGIMRCNELLKIIRPMKNYVDASIADAFDSMIDLLWLCHCAMAW